MPTLGLESSWFYGLERWLPCQAHLIYGPSGDSLGVLGGEGLQGGSLITKLHQMLSPWSDSGREFGYAGQNSDLRKATRIGTSSYDDRL